jgi:hypothetical protein
LADKASLKNRIEELLPLETLNMDREKLQPRLDNLAYQEEEFRKKERDLHAREEEIEKIK